MEHRDPGDEVEMGAQHWTLINAENTPGNIEANPNARPVRLDPRYDWVWQIFRSEQYRAQQEVWFPARPPEYTEIGSEMLTTCFQYKKKHWLLEWDDNKHDRHPVYKSFERISHLKVGQAEIKHYLSTSRSSGHTPASYNQGSLRRNSAGIGSKNQAVGIRPPALESDWSNTGKDEANLKFFTWSADNLSHRANKGHSS